MNRILDKIIYLTQYLYTIIKLKIVIFVFIHTYIYILIQENHLAKVRQQATNV